MEAAEAGSVAVLAEKPSVARDIARVLGAGTKGNGYLHGNGYVVTWAIGHLAALAQPHEINPDWRQWRRHLLPMLPEQWPLVVYEKTKDQFETVKQILNSPKVSRVVCATDAGREGELIFRYIYEAAHCAKPVSRLWISSLTPDAIRKGFDALRPAADYDGLADAAHGRSRADWLVGMNLSRAYSLAYDEVLSVGRVQTPTLAMIVERELAVRRFVPEDYLEVHGHLPSYRRPESAAHTRAHGFANALPLPGPRAPTRNRCNRPCACPPMEKRRSASRRAPAPDRPPSNPSNPRPSACRRPRSTISPSCSGTPTASSASARRRPWTPPKPSTNATS